MAREKKKRVELRTVDEDVAPVVDVVRLENPDTGHKPKNEEPIRLGSSDAGRLPSRLDVPSRHKVELRTHQPDIDVLIDGGGASAEHVEEAWGGSSFRRTPVPWGWFAIIGLVLAGALTWSLNYLKQADDQVEQIRDETESVLATEQREEQEAREARHLLGLIRDNGGGRISLILRLGIPQGLQSRRGVVIEKVLNKRWIYLDPPADAS